MKRLLNPVLNPAGLTALAAALYSLATAIWNVVQNHAAVDPQVIVSALAAFTSALTRQVVTPVADPRDGNGKPLNPPAT